MGRRAAGGWSIPSDVLWVLVPSSARLSGSPAPAPVVTEFPFLLRGAIPAASPEPCRQMTPSAWVSAPAPNSEDNGSPSKTSFPRTRDSGTVRYATCSASCTPTASRRPCRSVVRIPAPSGAGSGRAGETPGAGAPTVTRRHSGQRDPPLSPETALRTPTERA